MEMGINRDICPWGIYKPKKWRCLRKGIEEQSVILEKLFLHGF